jgi:serine/threonine protein kinase
MSTLALSLGAASLSTPTPLGSGVGLLAFDGPLPLQALQVLLVMLLAAGGLYLAIKILAGLGGLIGRLFRLIGRLIGHVFGTLGAIVQDALRTVGSLATGAFYLPVAVGSVALGRWSAARHFARASRNELQGAVLAGYRVAVAHPLRLFGVHALVEGFEQRLPEVLAEAPGRDRPRGGKRAFEGYEVIGSLPAGGSGAQLYHARPTAAKHESYATNGLKLPDEVVIKCFDLQAGSTLPQIVRENRALQAARSLGLVLEHELSPSRFHYVMPFVPGQDLAQVSRGLHARAGSEGLNNVGLRAAMGYTAGLLEILERFHGAGLWHKDIKPSNVIVNGERVELVDLGLVTPLASALTLTTHGTEYYRDPEMVRLAMQGVKVHEVDGVKFDLYSVGAVLYGLIENSFPAHGSLSRIGKRCPEALKFVVQRAMADLKDRYANASAMLADLRVLLAAPDPFQVRPVDLPSLGAKARGPLAAALASVAPFANLGFGAKTPPPLPSQAVPQGVTQVPPLPKAGPKQAPQRRTGRRLAVGMLAALVGFFALFGMREIRNQHHQRNVAVWNQYRAAAQREELAHAAAGAESRPLRLRFPNGESIALAPKKQVPPPPLLLVLRTPQALTLDDEQELVTELESALTARIFSERQPESAEDTRWSADIRHRVNFGDLSAGDRARAIEEYLRAEPQLGGVLWLDFVDSGKPLTYLWISEASGFPTRIAGQSSRRELASTLASQPLVRASFRTASRSRQAQQAATAPTAPYASQAPYAPMAPVGLEAATHLQPAGSRWEQQRMLELAREHELRLHEVLVNQAEQRSEDFEDWAEEFSDELEDLIEGLGDRFEGLTEQIEERLESGLDACGETIEDHLEAARLFPR